MKVRLTRERSISKAVTAHGSDRLLNGLVARLSFVAIRIFQSKKQDFFTNATREAYTRQLIRRNRCETDVWPPSTYTPKKARCFTKIKIEKAITGGIM